MLATDGFAPPSRFGWTIAAANGKRSLRRSSVLQFGASEVGNTDLF
jgi:hypothetical protein